MSVTIKDIAKLANVSPATVSRVLNNNTGFISEATKQKVLRIVKEQGYTPNPLARSLVTRQSYTLGAIVPDILNPFFSELIRGADDTAQKLGYSLILCNSDDNPEKEKKHIQFLSQRAVDGIILASGSVQTDSAYLDSFHIPVISIDRMMPQCDSLVASVSTDLEQCGYLPAAHFIQQGHTQIAFLCGRNTYEGNQKRYKGYCNALKEANIPLREELIKFRGFSHDAGYQMTKELLEQKVSFTAVSAMSDMLALGAMKALREANVRIPEDCAVIGCDDVFLSEMLTPPLSSVRRNNYDLAVKAVELIVSAIRQKEYHYSEVIFPPELILRKTT
ncbi:MAG: LacI family DNA-binding transcriptional regulator [Lachnospiraceae bacterium]|jgi:LacI family transcriptional regulator